MTAIFRSVFVPYSAEQMYILVNDIASYQEFVPYCASSIVHSKTDHEVRATLTLSAKGMKKSFTTCNRLQKNCLIEITLIDGPFKNLAGCWQFKHYDENRSEVILNLEFELVNKLFAMMFGPVFQQVSTSLVDAFAKRADSVYGKLICR